MNNFDSNILETITLMVLFFVFRNCLIFLGDKAKKNSFNFAILTVISVVFAIAPIALVDYFTRNMVIEIIMSFNLFYMLYLGNKVLK